VTLGNLAATLEPYMLRRFRRRAVRLPTCVFSRGWDSSHLASAWSHMAEAFVLVAAVPSMPLKGLDVRADSFDLGHHLGRASRDARRHSPSPPRRTAIGGRVRKTRREASCR